MLKILMIVTMLFCTACGSVVKINEETVLNIEKTKNIVYNFQNYPVSIVSLNSRDEKNITTYQKPPQKVVAVWQNSIEALLALGVGDRIIAGIGVPDRKYILPEYRDEYDKIPYKSLENLDLETIVMLEPDFILGWFSTFSNKVLRGTDFWAQREVNTYIAESSGPTHTRHTLEEEYNYILDLGKIFDRNEKAQKIVKKIQDEIYFTADKTKYIKKRPSAIIIEFMGKEIHVYGEKTLAGNIVQCLNGRLLEPLAINFSLEQLIAIDPDVIFLIITESQFGNEQVHLDRIYKNPALQDMKCIKKHRVHTIPLYAVYASGIRSYDGVKIISHGLYPEIYGE